MSSSVFIVAYVSGSVGEEYRENVRAFSNRQNAVELVDQINSILTENNCCYDSMDSDEVVQASAAEQAMMAIGVDVATPFDGGKGYMFELPLD